jgi:hypothetical protein
MSELANKLLERMKAAFPHRTPEQEKWFREANRRHDFMAHLQVNEMMGKIQYMSPGLYCYTGVPNKARPGIYLIDENHHLWDAAPGVRNITRLGSGFTVALEIPEDRITRTHHCSPQSANL